MRVPIVLAGVAATFMAVLITYASVAGRFSPEGGALFALAWGKVTLADLYIGFALFSGWVIFREGSRVQALVCVALVMTLGNAFAALYVMVALVRCRGDWAVFWLGDRASPRTPT
jgi:hypothetical protein